MARLHCVALFAVLAATARAQAALPADLDDRVAAAMAAFEVPGLCLAVVQDGQVLAAKGYGMRRLGDATKVDAETQFGIASNSKVFTATALGLLVEQGKLEWDAPVQRWLPAFALADPYVSHELSVRDLLVHRSGLGLGAGDLLWWPTSTYTRKEVVARLRHVPLATSFRSAYAYDNVLYLAAGELLEAVTGRTWEQFVGDTILTPVGMTHSGVHYDGNANGGNVAGTHARVDGVVQAVTAMASDNTNPAGGIMSGATDMAKWMMVLLGDGRLASGERLFSAATARALTSIVTPIPIGEPDPLLADTRPNFSGYALGLGVRDYRGHKVLTHTGGLPGYVSRVFMIPDLHFGVTVLTNQESMHAIDAIVYWLADTALGAPGKDWLTIEQQLLQKTTMEHEQTDAKAAMARDKDSKPSLALEKYAGTYRDAWYGDVVIEFSGGKLAMSFTHTPSLTGELEPWQHDTFVARWRERELRADAFVTFHLRPDGSVEQVKMVAASPEVDFSFDFHHLLLKPVRKVQAAGAR